MASAMDGMFNADQPDWDLVKVNIPILVLNANTRCGPKTTGIMSAGSHPDRVSDHRRHRPLALLEKPAEFNAP